MQRAACILGVAVFLVVVAAVPIAAQPAERVWEQGTVWDVQYVQTKPGQFNAYIKDLSQVWRAFMEEQKKMGDVVSYKMLSVVSPRDDEPDLILLTEYKNMAVYDRTAAEFEELTKKVMGSLEEMQQANIDRGQLRDLRGSILTREIHFMK